MRTRLLLTCSSTKIYLCPGLNTATNFCHLSATCKFFFCFCTLLVAFSQHHSRLAASTKFARMANFASLEDFSRRVCEIYIFFFSVSVPRPARRESVSQLI